MPEELSPVKPAKAFAVSAGLGALFLIIYPVCNWITSQRSDIGTFYFQWERGIPFVPFMILPYLSIDFLFLTAPFFCRTDGELRTFTKRVVAALVLAGICFLLFPLRFAFERPHVSGWMGAVFDSFHAFDPPYNLCPSLHVAFWVILFDLFRRRTRGWLLALVVIWFALIAPSPVLTYQHHVVDVVGGLVLAAFCFYLFPEAPRQPRQTGRTGDRRLGGSDSARRWEDRRGGAKSTPKME